MNSPGLKPENGGSSSRLSASQTAALIGHLSELTYHDTYQIVAYVQEKSGVQYTVSGMNKWLHHNGFSDEKPKGGSHKFDETKQQYLIDAYEALKASCGRDESILSMDALHPTQATKLSYGWLRKGQEKALAPPEAKVVSTWSVR